jgi:ribosome-associated protein
LETVYVIQRQMNSSDTQVEDASGYSGRGLALQIADIISDTPASNTLVLDIHEMSPFADYFVICDGENERQLRAIAREIGDSLSKQGVRPERTEGSPNSGWILMDYGATVVHVFDVDQRRCSRFNRSSRKYSGQSQTRSVR